jgi:hypothetical protein
MGCNGWVWWPLRDEDGLFDIGVTFKVMGIDSSSKAMNGPQINVS